MSERPEKAYVVFYRLTSGKVGRAVWRKRGALTPQDFDGIEDDIFRERGEIGIVTGVYECDGECFG